MYVSRKAWLGYHKAGLLIGALIGATYTSLLVDYPSLMNILDLPAKLFSTIINNPTVTFLFPVIFYAVLGAYIEMKIKMRTI